VYCGFGLSKRLSKAMAAVLTRESRSAATQNQSFEYKIKYVIPQSWRESEDFISDVETLFSENKDSLKGFKWEQEGRKLCIKHNLVQRPGRYATLLKELIKQRTGKNIFSVWEHGEVEPLPEEA
jgi:hypothetical protein